MQGGCRALRCCGALQGAAGCCRALQGVRGLDPVEFSRGVVRAHIVDLRQEVPYLRAVVEARSVGCRVRVADEALRVRVRVRVRIRSG